MSRPVKIGLILIVLFVNCALITVYCVDETSIPDCEFIIKLSSPEPQYRGFFGSSSVILNNTIVIGEPGPYSETPSSGKVWFFNLEGNLTKELESPIEVNTSYFGYALTICNDLLIVGDPGITVDSLNSAGMVHFYTLDGGYVKSITSNEPMENGEFGRSLASNDEIFLIGEPGPQIYDENITSRVQVYDKTGDYLFTIQQSEARTGCFGMSIAVNNDTIVVSEPYYSRPRGHWQGIVYLFDLQGNLIRNITSPFYLTTPRPRNFGFRVSANDNIVAVGEVRGNVEGHDFAGRAFIYNRRGELLTNLTSLKPTGYAGFGYLRVWNDLILVEDYVRVENFTERIGAVIYDMYGSIRAVVSSRDYEWVRGFPIAFNDEYVVLGDIIGFSGGVEYAGNVFVCRVPDEIWELEFIVENNSTFLRYLLLVIGVSFFIFVVKRKFQG